MATTVNLIVRKFVCGTDIYRRAMHISIDVHPERDKILDRIKEQGVDYLDTAPAQ